MRQDQLWLMQDDVIHEQKIEVYDAWSLGNGVGPVTAHLSFNLEELNQELFGGEVCFQKQRTIQKLWLIEIADGVSLTPARDADYPAKAPNTIDCLVERGVPIAPG